MDEIELSGPPDQVTIRGLAAPIKKKIRTKRSDAYEKVTVKQLAEKVASRNGLSIQGVFGKNANLVHARVSQNREEDLSFLRRVAGDYGIVFNVRGNKMIFTDQQQLEARSAALTIDRTEMTSWTFRDKSVKTYSGAQVAFKDPSTDKVVQAAYKSSGSETPDFIQEAMQSDTFKEIAGEFGNASDILQLKDRAENEQQAQAKAQAALYRANTKQREGSFKAKGDPLLCAGNNITITGMGKMSGKWSIESSSHSFTKGGGYSTDCTLKQVGK